MIREYERAGFFPPGTGRAPLDEEIPTPRDREFVVFRDFFICGLRFPCDPILPAILDAFSVKIHQLSPTSFLEMSKFIWIMKTFGCNPSVDAFARFYELVIIPEVIKGSDGQFYHTQHACVPSTPVARTPERESPEFRLLRAASLTSPRTGTLIGFI
jgi:hypothetical protein